MFVTYTKNNIAFYEKNLATWEATLAVPYGWWGYHPRAMIGLDIGAWSNLPVEAVCVWLAVTYTTVITTLTQSAR